MIQVPSPTYGSRSGVAGPCWSFIWHSGQGVFEERTRHRITERASPLERCLVAHEPSCAFADPPLKSLGVPES